MQRSHEVTFDDQRRDTEQNQKYGIDSDHDLKDVVDDPQPAHQRVVKYNIVIKDACNPKDFPKNRYHRDAGQQQEGQKHPAQRHTHLAVEVVRQHPVGNLHRAHGADVLEPVSPAEVGIPAGSADEGFRDEVAHRESVSVAIFGEAVELIALMSVFDPYPLVAHRADQDQARVQMDVVCLQFLHKGRIASEIIIVIPDHHGHLDARTGGPELIENRLVRLYDVRKPFDPAYKRELPEPKRVAHDQKFGVGAVLFQLLQEFDELGGVIAMLQLTVAAHVQVTDKVILLCQSMISVPDRSKISDRGSYTCSRISRRPA